MARILVSEELAEGGLNKLRAAGHEVDVQTGLSPEQLQKAEIEIGIDFAWLFAGLEQEIVVTAVQKSTQKPLEIEGENKLLLSQNEGQKHNATPDSSNKPVVVGEVDTSIPEIDGVDVLFNMFFDGTMNNMNNTKSRVEPDDLHKGVYAEMSNKKDDSL